MNRVGLAVVMTIAVIVGLIFAVRPRFDLEISALFYNPKVSWGEFNAQPWVLHARDAARALITLLVAPAIVTLLGKLIWPRRRMLIDTTAALFLALTLAVGPGLIANTTLKDHWGRVRPIDVRQFGGDGTFTPWWDPRGDCPNNCSFIAGEPAGAFWTLAPAALAPPQWRLLAYGAAVTFGTAIGALRIAGGGHFFTDVVFAGVIMYLLIWTAHGLLYRWRRPRTAVDTILWRIGWSSKKPD